MRSEITNNSEDVLNNITSFEAEFELRIKPIRDHVQAYLKTLAGQSFGSLEENIHVARSIQDLLNHIGMRVQCPRQDCHEPALLQCSRAGRTRHGSFRFVHIINGKMTNHAGSTTLPQLQLIPARIHRGRKNNR